MAMGIIDSLTASLTRQDSRLGLGISKRSKTTLYHNRTIMIHLRLEEELEFEAGTESLPPDHLKKR